MRHAWIAIALLGACDEPVETLTVDAIAEACVDDGALVVRFQACLSSSCDTLLSATCAATAAGQEVTVTGLARIERRGRECTSDCGLVEARCPVPEGVDPETAALRFEGDDGGAPLSEAICTGP